MMGVKIIIDILWSLVIAAFLADIFILIIGGLRLAIVEHRLEKELDKEESNERK